MIGDDVVDMRAVIAPQGQCINTLTTDLGWICGARPQAEIAQDDVVSAV